MASILIVEDDFDIAEGIAEYLQRQGHQLDFAYNGRQATQRLAEDPYDLVLLDINLPYVDGYDVCQTLIEGKPGENLSRVPVIMMSARDKEQDILNGFYSGAWDYLIKPFSFAELAARVNVSLKKANTQLNAPSYVELNGLKLDVNGASIQFDGKTDVLFSAGVTILQLLMKHAPATVKTAQFHQELWNGETPESDPLRAHIYKLRKQLKDRFGVDFIQTVKGVGYRLVLSEETQTK